jgi:hypothetical protein
MTTSFNVYGYLKWLHSTYKNITFPRGIENWFVQTVEGGFADRQNVTTMKS